MKPVPILYTIPNLDTAGSGGALLNIVTRLDRNRFAPAICTLRRGGRLEQKVESLGIPLLQGSYTLAAKPWATFPFRARKAAATFTGRGFALWHSFHYLDDYTEPVVARLVGARAWIYTKKNMNWNRRSWLLRSLQATRIAAQNTDMVQKFFDGALLRKRTVLLPRGVDTERFRPEIPPRLEMRKKLGVSSQDVVVGCVAHLLPVKGHETLIRAVAAVPGARLWLAGRELDAEYVSRLRDIVREAGLEARVTFLGEVHDVPALLSELDIFVLPTWDEWRMEGCPVALLEAMSSGRACVASDIPGSRDLVETGRSGMLVRPRDVEALGEAIGRLAKDAPLRRALGEAASQRIRRVYTIETEVRAHEDLYTDVLGLQEAATA
jgi:glycosyltransferase involved in cell wall biosynthesis